MEHHETIRAVMSGQITNPNTLQALTNHNHYFLTLAIAQSKNTAPETLKEIYTELNRKPFIKEAIAANPNTGIQELLHIIETNHSTHPARIIATAHLQQQIAPLLAFTTDKKTITQYLLIGKHLPEIVKGTPPQTIKEGR